MMFDQEVFNENVSLLASYDAILAHKICQGTSCNVGEEFFGELPDLKNIGVLYVYGVGQGNYYDVVEKWLKLDHHRRIIFFEDDIAVLRHFLGTVKGSKLLHSDQVKIVFLDWEQFPVVVSRLVAETMLLDIEVVASNINKKRFEEFQSIIMKMTAATNYVAWELYNYGERFFKNFYANLWSLRVGCQGQDLYGHFKDVPAIICGAGPSLAKDFSVLENVADKTLIFAGGSALSVLSAHHITPHFGVLIDPLEREKECISPSQTYEIPFFCSCRLNKDIFELMNGPGLFVSADLWYPIVSWVEEQLGIELPSRLLGRGSSVVTLSLEVAHALGCNPIILTGVDLAYTDMALYADGVVDDASVVEKTILSGDDKWKGAVKVNDSQGNPIYTRWEWLVEAEWLSNYALHNKDITILNSTVGGLEIPYLSPCSLKELAQEFSVVDLNSKVLLEVERSRFNISKEQVNLVIDSIEQSLKELLEQIDDALLADEFSDNMAYQYILRPMLVVVRPALQRENIDELVFLREAAKNNLSCLEKYGRPVST